MDDWDQMYLNEDYLSHWDYKYPSQELIGFCSSFYKIKGKKSLDIGCGSGTEAIFLAKIGFDSMGIDISGEALKLAEKKSIKENVPVKWLKANALNLPLENNSIFFINDRGCYHNLEKNERPTFAKEMARILSDDGILFLRGGLDLEAVASPVTEDDIKENFTNYFSIGPILPLLMISDAGSLESNLVVLKKLEKK